MNSTLELLAEVGYERLTIDAIAARAGASKSTIYRRWEGKRQLIVDALREMDTGQPDLPANAASLRADLFELLHLIRGLVDVGDVRIFSDLLSVAQRDPEIARAMRQDLVARRLRECRDVVQRAVGRGELAHGRSGDLLFDVLVGQVIVRTVLRGQQLDDNYVAHVIDDVLIPVLMREES
jgi:AcrR family transcriptional regulator